MNTAGTVKVGFTRAFAIFMMEAIHAEGDEPLDYHALSNEELAIELCTCGYVYDDDMGGVFSEIPPEFLDAEKVGDVTGWPLAVQEYALGEFDEPPRN